MEVSAVASAHEPVATTKENVAPVQSKDKLEEEIKRVAEELRLMRAKLKEAGTPWRSDHAAMEKVFELMKLKFQHPKYRHETLPEKEHVCEIKLRWKVIVDGKVVVLQRPFRQMPVVTDTQIREAVSTYTQKKFPGTPTFERILLLVDKTTKVDLCKEVRLNVLFPGPKFQTTMIVRLECENAPWIQYCKDKPLRNELHKKKLEEDKQRVEARKAEKRAAKAAADAVAAGAPKGKKKGKKAPKKGGKKK